VQRRHLVALAAIGCAVGCGAAADELIGVPNRTSTAPAGWFGGSSVEGNFFVGFDRGIRHTGGVAGFIEAASVATEGFGVLAQQVKADRYRGQRVRWSGWVRGRELGSLGGGLWMRIDGPGTLQGFDNMLDRPLLGTSGWHEVAVVLDVPANAIGIAIGALVAGPGELVVDDLKLEIVGKDIGATSPLVAAASGVDSATTANNYARSNLSPVNLDFEDNRASASRNHHGTLAFGADYFTTSPKRARRPSWPATSTGE
jgi:hypothetical protein